MRSLPRRLQKMTDMLLRWTQGGVPEPQYRADLALLDELSQAMSLTSICGLGQIGPAPIQSVLKHFRAEIDAHVLKGQCTSGICFTPAAPPVKHSALEFAPDYDDPLTTRPGLVDITIDGQSIRVPAGTSVF